MTNRFYTKDYSMMNTLLGYKYSDNTPLNAQWYNNSLTIIIWNWDQISSINQTLIATLMTTNGYQFDHDE